MDDRTLAFKVRDTLAGDGTIAEKADALGGLLEGRDATAFAMVGGGEAMIAVFAADRWLEVSPEPAGQWSIWYGIGIVPDEIGSATLAADRLMRVVLGLPMGVAS